MIKTCLIQATGREERCLLPSTRYMPNEIEKKHHSHELHYYITQRRNHTKVGFYHVCQASFDFVFKPVELLSFHGDANK